MATSHATRPAGMANGKRTNSNRLRSVGQGAAVVGDLRLDLVAKDRI